MYVVDEGVRIDLLEVGAYSEAVLIVDRESGSWDLSFGCTSTDIWSDRPWGGRRMGSL